MALTGIEYLFFVPKDEGTYIGVATGTFVNRNHLAGYLLLTLSLGIGMMISKLNFTSEQNWRARAKRFLTTLLSSKASLRLILIIMVAGLVMTHSRMGNTAFFASLSITGVLALILHKGSLRSVLILITSLIIIDIFVVGTFFGVDKVAERLSNTSASTETRDEVNSYTLIAINDHMLTGSGAGTFYTDFPMHRDYLAGSSFYDKAHNDYFQFASEYGVPITILLIIAVFICALMAAQAIRTRKDPLLRGLAFGCLMAIIAFAIHSTVDFNLQIPANALTFIILLACGYIALYKKKSRS
ncbi:O-antigen ligase family protein [Aliamphritea ceti]|uniref:O-antigen ligase family protein n=1 Tax=Aliamphritea ceti TaxID=1524258 RepID=UPI0021C2886F|nr:O-antigen ligase family protein [Aliamphritea ceti]